MLTYESLKDLASMDFMSWSEKEKREINKLRYDTLDSRHKECPVCGKVGQRIDNGEFKHTRRIRISPSFRQVQTTYCKTLKREA